VTLIVGEEYRPPFYGHVFFIGLRDHLISPFTTGYEGTAIDSLYPSNTDMFIKAKAQGAVVGYVHAFSGESDPLEKDLGVGRAFPVDAALGSIHAMEWSTASGAALRVWHHALNNDLPIAVAGGEDSITSLHRTKTVGSVRTYAFIGNESTSGKQRSGIASKKPWSAERWIGALKQGKTFYSSGPLLEFSINGRIPGERFDLPTAGSVNLVGEVWSIVPLERAVIYSNGKPWKNLPLSGDCRHLSFRETAAVTSSCWFSLTAEGTPTSHPLDANYPQGTTSAIRVYIGHQPIRNRSSAEYFIRWIDKLKGMADAAPGWRSREERDHVLGQFDAARQVYERFAKEADALR